MPRILLCHCSHTRILPAEVQEAVVAALRAAGAEFEEAPDLCELAARQDPALRRITEAANIKIAACYPRAVKWVFAAGNAPLNPGRTEIVNVRTGKAEEIISALLSPEVKPNLPPGKPGSERPLPCPPITENSRADVYANTTGPWQAWFPLIDFDRCTQCLQCLGFCLFGVYGVDAQHHIRVEHPENCKVNCPACSRVCPEAAIIFPKYKSAPINGDAVDENALGREKIKIDISALLGGDVYAVLRERSQRAQSRFSRERDPDAALKERQRCLARLAELGDIPPEVLMSLPSPEEIQRRAAEAQAKAKAARGEQ